MNRWHIKFNSALTAVRFQNALEENQQSKAYHISTLTADSDPNYNWVLFSLPEGVFIPQAILNDFADKIIAGTRGDEEIVLGSLEVNRYSNDPEFVPKSRSVYSRELGDNLGSVGFREFEHFIHYFGEEAARSLLNGNSDELYGFLSLHYLERSAA